MNMITDSFVSYNNFNSSNFNHYLYTYAHTHICIHVYKYIHSTQKILLFVTCKWIILKISIFALKKVPIIYATTYIILHILFSQFNIFFENSKSAFYLKILLFEVSIMLLLHGNSDSAQIANQFNLSGISRLFQVLRSKLGYKPLIC